jgi:N-acetylneuraminate synthase
MTLPIDKFRISRHHQLWGGENLFSLYGRAMTPWEWHQELFEYASKLGIVAFSSPFDRTAVDFLEDLKCPIYKVASLETGDIDLIRYIGETKKPIIISTGASTLQEIESAIQAAFDGGTKKVTLLLCTSSYPANPKQAHLARLQTLSETFNLPIGISDHTLGIGVSVAAIALGASVVEKHLTLKRDAGGPDDAFSLEPSEFATLVQEGEAAAVAIGNSTWQILDSEEESRKLRRSLYVVKDVKTGEIATRENVRALRPNGGSPVSNLSSILGKVFKRDILAGEPALPQDVE